MQEDWVNTQSSFAYPQIPGGDTVLKSCKYCGRIHKAGYVCSMKPKKRAYDYSDREVWKFRHGEAWKVKAEQIKERDGWLCRCCLSKKVINYTKLEVHHIVPLAEDLSLRLDDDNLITLCRVCHEEAEKGNITREELRGMLPEERGVPCL